MKKYSITEAKKEFNKIIESIENKENNCVVITKYGKPTIKIEPYEEKDVKRRLGIAEGLIDIPEELLDNFDEIDISKEFEGYMLN